MLNGNGIPDRAVGWVKRWTLRYLLYTGMTWVVATLVWLPYYIVVIKFSALQIEVYLVTSLPFCLLAYLALAPFGRWVWQSIWRIEHGVTPWWKAATSAQMSTNVAGL